MSKKKKSRSLPAPAKTAPMAKLTAKNFKEELMEKYFNGELPIVTRRESFCFDCVQCGECCRNRGDILLNPFDVFRLCRKLNIEPEAFINKYCERYAGYSSKLPLIRIDFRPVYGLGDTVEGMRCPFLSNRGGLYYCRVHDSKPFVCFSYPLGRMMDPEKGVQYILQNDGSCKGTRNAHQDHICQNVEQWMGGKEKLDLEEKFYLLHSDFLMKIRTWIDVAKLAKYQKGQSKEYGVWLAMVGHLLYCNYDLNKPEDEFPIQFEKNMELIRTLCEAFISEMNAKLDLRPKESAV